MATKFQNMIVYKGSSRDDFKIEKWKRSRYGFNALFFASNIELAKLHAQHEADEENKINGGFVYEFEIQGYLHSIDYGYKISYSSDFENLMYKLYREGHKGVIIKNIFVYPSKKLTTLNLSDVIVIFDFDLIKSFKLIQRNVKS
jgi:hypothetical protein